MAFPIAQTGAYTNATATTTVKTGQGSLLGIFVASTSTGTLKVQDGAATIVNTFTPAAATFYPLPFNFTTSLIVTAANTIDFTVAWIPGPQS